MPRGKRSKRQRRGATVTEFAITLPLLVLFVFASLEFSRANMLVHSCEIAATEGARRGIIPGASATEVRDATIAELQIVGVSEMTVNVTPSTITSSSQTVTVDITVPFTQANGYVVPNFFLGRNIQRSVTLQREALTN